MTAAELLLDLAERLTEADTKLRDLAAGKRWSDKERDEHIHLTGKAEGVRLALGYIRELQRMAGADL